VGWQVWWELAKRGLMHAGGGGRQVWHSFRNGCQWSKSMNSLEMLAIIGFDGLIAENRSDPGAEEGSDLI